MNRLKIAFFSPLTPQRTGISDYSEELLPYLGELADIDIVVGSYAPENETISRRFRIIDADEFLNTSEQYDVALYQVGNNFEYHGYMIPCMQKKPGIVVLHEYFLGYLTIGLTLKQGDLRSLYRIIRRTEQQRALRLAIRLLVRGEPPYSLPLAAPYVELNQAVIVHNRTSRSYLHHEFPDMPAQVIPMGIAIHPERRSDDGSFRRRLGLKPDDFVLLSIGNLSFNKRAGVVLKAMELMGAAGACVKYVLAGSGRIPSREQRLIDAAGLQGRVHLTGWLSSEDYRNCLAMADAVVDLRYPSAGETSASILRALEAGKPCVLSAHGFFLELPQECCLRIPVDDGGDELSRAILTLVTDEPLRLAMGEASRRFAVGKLQLRHAAAAYLDFIRERMSGASLPPDHTWLTARPPNRIERALVGGVYRISRFFSLVKLYGLRDTIGRYT